MGYKLMGKDKKSKLHTEHALIMLSCILERIAIECRDNENGKPEYYSNMASTAVMLADYINHIENDKELIDIQDDCDTDV